MENLNLKEIDSIEKIKEKMQEIDEKSKTNIVFKRMPVQIGDVYDLMKQFITLYDEKGQKNEFQKELYSKLDGKKEQKRGKNSPDYVIKSFKTNIEENAQGKYIAEWQTPFTFNKLQIKPDDLENIIENELKRITKEDIMKIISIKLVNNIFYVVVKSFKNYLEDEDLKKYFQQF